MKKLNFLIFLFIYSSVSIAETNYLNCVIERAQTSGYMETDTTKVIKTNEPLIKIDDGDFTLFVGNKFNSEMFPDSIDALVIGKPKKSLLEDYYKWDHSSYFKRSGFEAYRKLSYALARDTLILTQSNTVDFSSLGAKNLYSTNTYQCSFVTKEKFDTYMLELSEKYKALNAEVETAREETESKRQI
jgi:hypothetical protein